jgi:hypothetical protein
VEADLADVVDLAQRAVFWAGLDACHVFSKVSSCRTCTAVWKMTGFIKVTLLSRAKVDKTTMN